MAAVYPKQYVHVSVSISDCSKIFDLGRYTPEQIVESVFAQAKSRPLAKDQFIQTFKTLYERNAPADMSGKVSDAAARIYEVCSQGAQEITVDQLGKGIGAFTTKREPNSAMRDLFFYLDKEFKGVLQESDLQNFISEASNKGVSKSLGSELTDLKNSVTRDKGKMELTYWTLFVWKSHPAVAGLLEIYKEIQGKKQLSSSNTFTSTQQTTGVKSPVLQSFGYTGSSLTTGGSEQVVEISGQTNAVEKDKKSGRGGGDRVAAAPTATTNTVTTVQAPAVTVTSTNPQEPQKRRSISGLFQGTNNMLANRSTGKIKDFNEFLSIGTQLGLHDISAQEYMRRSRDFFAKHTRSKGGNGDLTLFEFIRLCVDNFKRETDDYYKFTSLVTQLFQFMDVNGNGILEIAEAVQGIIHLFGGTEEDKISAVFMLFDVDNSGFIDFNEVLNFILSTIKLTQNQGEGITPEKEEQLKDIAYATAKDVFKTMDINNDSRVSLEEFLTWFRSTKGVITPAETEHAKASKQQKLQEFNQKVEELKKAQAGVRKDISKEEMARLQEQQKAATYVINESRKKIPLDRVHIQLACQHLMDKFPSRVVNFQEFVSFIEDLVKVHDLPGKQHAKEVARVLFNALDTNKNGLLEVSEIAIGLGLLCGGSKFEKMKAGFDLFDENSDRTLTFQETVNYMGSFFKIIGSNNPDLSIKNGDPIDYAKALALCVFQESGIPLDGTLEFFHFKQWVNSANR